MNARPQREGQTIIEAVIALGVLTAGFLGMLSLLSHSFAENRRISEQTTATYLAAEGIELTKNLLDHTMYYGHVGGTWPCFSAMGTYAFDYRILTDGSSCSTLSPASPYWIAAGSVAPLEFDTSSDSYIYSPSSGSGSCAWPPPAGNGALCRGITIDYATGTVGSDAVIVHSVVTWRGHEVDLKDEFYNWY